MLKQEIKPLRQNTIIKNVVKSTIQKEILPVRSILKQSQTVVRRKEVIQPIDKIANNSNIIEKEQQKENH